MKSRIDFHFGKARTPHAQGYVEIVVKALKVALNRTIGPFGRFTTTAEMTFSTFKNVLANIPRLS